MSIIARELLFFAISSSSRIYLVSWGSPGEWDAVGHGRTRSTHISEWPVRDVGESRVEDGSEVTAICHSIQAEIGQGKYATDCLLLHDSTGRFGIPPRSNAGSTRTQTPLLTIGGMLAVHPH